MKFSGLLCLFFAIAFGQEELTDSNFDSVVDGSKNVFVMFYAPWCGHCKKFKPEYADVYNSFKSEDSVVIASVDADNYRDIGSKYGVTGFPSLKYFPKGSTKPEDYSAGRTASDVIEFINNKAGTNAKITEAPSLVTILTQANFEEIALNKENNALVEFYAPWCGHCKKLKPIYEELAKAFENDENVIIGKVDATEHESLASSYGVKGYPTIKWFGTGQNGDKPTEYSEGRTLQHFVDFVNENAGTRRNTDGSLKLSAGRVPELDQIANKFYKNTNENERNELKNQIQTLCNDESKFKEKDCKYYLKFLSKITEKGNDFVTNEILRLSKLLKSESVTKDKKDSMKLRKNILNGFIEGNEMEFMKSQEKEANIKTEL